MEHDKFINSISMNWNEISNYDDIEAYIKKYPRRRLVINIFPHRILNPDKQDQVSIFYRKLLDKEISKKEFLYNKCYFKLGLCKRFFRNVKNQDVLLDISDLTCVQIVLELALREAGILWMHFKEWEVLARVCDFNIELIVREEAILQKITPLLALCALDIFNRTDGEMI